MQYIERDKLVHIEWSIFRGTSHVPEDFSRALVKVFLIGTYEKYLLTATAQGGTLVADLPQGLPEGAYSLEAVWVKNYGNLLPKRQTLTPSMTPPCPRRPGPRPNDPCFIHPNDDRFNDRCLMRSRKDYLFALTNYASEATVTDESGEVTVKCSSAVATYGYDGLSAYELAVMRGDFSGTEGEFLAQSGFTKLKTINGESIIGEGDIKITSSGTLEMATETKLGGIRAATKTQDETVEVKIDPATGKLYVPAGGGGSGTTSIPQANASVLGGIKASNRTSNETLEAKIDPSSGKLFVEDTGLTIDERDKFDGIEEGANKTIVENNLTDSTVNPPSNKVVKENINNIQQQVYALSGIDNPFIGLFDDVSKLPSQSSPAWALVGDLEVAKPYAYYVAGSVPTGYSQGWNDLSQVLGTYDFTESSVWGYIVPYHGLFEERMTLGQAIEKVPQALRKAGLRLLFVDESGSYQEYIALASSNGSIIPEPEPTLDWEQGSVTIQGLQDDSNRIRSIATELNAGNYTVSVNDTYNVVVWDVTSEFNTLTSYGASVSFTLSSTSSVRFVIKKLDDSDIKPNEIQSVGFDLEKGIAALKQSGSQDEEWIEDNFKKVLAEDWGASVFYGITQKLFTQKTFIFNADYESPLEAGNYYTLDQVIDMVPDVLVKPGLLLMFKAGSHQYKIYQFISTNKSEFTNKSVRNVVFKELTNSANDIYAVSNSFPIINNAEPNNLYSVRNVFEIAVNNTSPGDLLYPSQIEYKSLWNYRVAIIPVEGEKTYTLSGWHIPTGKSISLLDINKNVLDTRNMNSSYSGSNIVKMGEWNEPGDITVKTPSKCCYVAINVANDTYKDYFKFANITFIKGGGQKELPELSWEQGSVTVVGLQEDSNRIRSIAEDLNSGTYTASVNSDYNVVAWDVTSENEMLTNYGTSISFTLSTTRSVRFVIKRLDENDITQSEILSTGFNLGIGQGYAGVYAKGQKHLAGYVDFDDIMLNDLSWPSGFVCRTQIRVLADKTRTKFIPLFDVHSKIIKGNKTVYISPDGDHSGTGLLPSTAVKTIAEALALNPSTIVFLSGTYVVDTNYYENQQITEPINLIGYGEVTIDNLEKSPIQIKNNAYIENIHFKGGINGALNPYLLNDDYYVACYKCKFTDAKTSASLGGFRAQGGNYYMVDCEASDNFYDGFNYHAIDGHIPHVLEIDCRGYMNGIGSDYYSQNCSTAHEGAKVIRVNCDYGYSQGGVIADANANTVSVNIGCVAHSSLWFGTGYQNYNVSFWTGSGATMYLIGCRSYGSNYDLSVESGSSIYSDDLFDKQYNDGSGIIKNISYF